MPFISRNLTKGISLGIVWVSAFSFQAHGDFILHSWEDQFPKSSFSLGLASNYFNTTSNFTNTGSSTVTPSGFTSYERISNDLSLAIPVIGPLALFGRLNWSFIDLTSTSRGGTAYGFGDQTLGLALRLTGFTLNPSINYPNHLNDQFMIDLQIQVDFPGYNDTTSYANSIPPLGDGSIDLSAGIFAIARIAEGRTYRFETHLGAGYTYRTDGFSAALPWSLVLKLIPQLSGFSLDVGAQGFLSLQTDNSLSPAQSDLQSGGSAITGVMDPTLFQLSLKPGYKLSPEMQLQLLAKVNLWGQNAPTGLILGLGFQMQFGKVKETLTEKQITPIRPVEPDPEKTAFSDFATYSMDANIIKTNDRLNLVKINKGSQDGIEVGEIFDIFNVKVASQDGEAIARAQVTHLKTGEAVLEISEFYKEVPIEEGFVVKRLIQ